MRRVVTLIVVAFLFCFSAVSYAWSGHLPLSKDLTVRLSSLSSQGQLQTVSETVARTDALGKIAFGFPTVPSSATTPFLHIQIMDGENVLRQAIVPSPQPGGAVDVGVSEVTDLQARALLKAAALSGRLTPVYMLIAQALLRTPVVSTTDAEAIGPAIVAGVDAMSAILATDGLTTDQHAAFMVSLREGLVVAAGRYRKSVDDSTPFDQNVEAYLRGEAYAVLLQSLIDAGIDAKMNLETVSTAFAAAGAAIETALESNPDVTTVSRAVMRLGYVTGILSLSNYRVIRELVDSLKYAGFSPPKFSRFYSLFDLVLLNTTNSLKSSSLENDLQGVQIQELNAVARQDLMMVKIALESYTLYTSSEYSGLMLEITMRMAAMGGGMAGMTPEQLLEILGRGTSIFELLAPEQQALSMPVNVPTLMPYELAAWAYIHMEPGFAYTPVAGLIDQLVSKPTVIPQFDKLGEPYKSLALLMYDLNLISNLRWQDQQDADTALEANSLNPQRWYPLATVRQILENNYQRWDLVRQHMSGLSPEAKNALIYLGSYNRFVAF
ncbi:hypothetical protein [Geobacter benzoatilyticus]|uniref:Uncharacterized protein n=1 Tax=Geobacter benzoatilyticus TaxID=2815309 RepID=A0ABX7Q3Q7_9BACT|nr:hypothetical protein [Geobacter benzoatilyticus]QSV46019.1 hypothetical protein JZM60_01610 [Geobacter benzoatilyticus]